MSDNKIEILKKMQESELTAIKGQHERALKRLKAQQKNELESLNKKHHTALKISQDRIVYVEKTEVESK